MRNMLKMILCFALVVLLAAQPVYAETKDKEPQPDENGFFAVRVQYGGKPAHLEQALREKDIWYFSTGLLSDVSGYEYDSKTGSFLTDKAAKDRNKATGTSDTETEGTITIDHSGKTIQKGSDSSALTDIVTKDEIIYLPAGEALPYLDMECKVEENVLILTDVGKKEDESLTDYIKNKDGDYDFGGFWNKLKDNFGSGTDAQASGSSSAAEQEKTAAEKIALANKQLKDLKAVDDTAEKAYRRLLQARKLSTGTKRLVYLADLNGDDISELMYGEYSSSKDTFNLYEQQKGINRRLFSWPEDSSSDICTCVFVAENGKKETGLMRVRPDLDMDKLGDVVKSYIKSMGEDLPMSVIAPVIRQMNWEFFVLDKEGKYKKAKEGVWNYGKDKTAVLDNLQSEYLWNAVLVFRSGNKETMDMLEAAGIEYLTDSSQPETFWFGYLGDTQ